MKKSFFILMCFATIVIGCAKDKNNGGGAQPIPPYGAYGAAGYPGYGLNRYGTNGMMPGMMPGQMPYNTNCPGFNGGQVANQYRWTGNVCVDLRTNQNVPNNYCQYNTMNNGWGQVGQNPTNFNPACMQYGMNNQNYQLNYFYSGACSFLNKPDAGLYYREVVFPNTQVTSCVEYSMTQNFQNSYGGAGNPMMMQTYPGALIGCIPGSYQPSGCNCVAVGAGGGGGFGIYAGIGPFGIYAGAGAGAGGGYQSAGICY